MSRSFGIPGVLFILAAFVLNLLASISLPWLHAFDVARVHFSSPAGSGAVPQVQEGRARFESIDQIRYGVWAYCIYDANGNDNNDRNDGDREDRDGDRRCFHRHGERGYSTELFGPSNSVTIKRSRTRGLVAHPAATAVTFVAVIFGLSENFTVSSIISFLAALVTAGAMGVDIAFFIRVRDRTNDLTGVDTRTRFGVAFWCTVAALVLLLLGGLTVCFGRRRRRTSDSEAFAYPAKPGIFGRLRIPFRRQVNTF